MTNVTKVHVRVFLFLCVLVQFYILRFFRAVIDQQTWTDLGSVSERRLRSEVLSLACHLNDPGCVQRAHQSFNDWLLSNYTLKYISMSTHYQSPSDVDSHQLYLLLVFQYFTTQMCILVCVYLSLPTDVAETVYSVGAKDDHGWTSLLHVYNISLSEAQKNQILFALTCNREPNKLNR